MGRELSVCKTKRELEMGGVRVVRVVGCERIHKEKKMQSRF